MLYKTFLIQKGKTLNRFTVWVCQQRESAQGASIAVSEPHSPAPEAGKAGRLVLAMAGCGAQTANFTAAYPVYGLFF